MTYETAHRAVVKARGKAKEHACWICGRSAAHWAHDHRNSGTLTNAAGRTFSGNVDHYNPLCVTCHVNFDLPPDHYFTLAMVINIDCTHCGASAGQLCRTPDWSGIPGRELHEGAAWQHAPRRKRPEVKPLLVSQTRPHR